MARSNERTYVDITVKLSLNVSDLYEIDKVLKNVCHIYSDTSANEDNSFRNHIR